MIRVSITRDWASGDITDRDEWSVETDAAYSPDIADDLARRVTAMRSADRIEMRELNQEEEA